MVADSQCRLGGISGEGSPGSLEGPRGAGALGAPGAGDDGPRLQDQGSRAGGDGSEASP